MMASSVLQNFLLQREGAAERVGVSFSSITAQAEQTNLTANELAGLLGAASSTASGASVTADTAMRVPAVYACVARIAGAISSMPLNVYERTASARKAALDHDYWWLMNESASEDWTSAMARTYIIAAKLFYGDGMGIWLRASPYSSRVVGWEPVHPLRLRAFRDEASGKVYYRYTRRDGTQTVLDKADVIHLPSLGFDGLSSPSPITHAAREAIGAGIAAEQFSARFFSQGSTHDIALKVKNDLSPSQTAVLRQSYLAKNAGITNSRVPLILTGGMEVEKLSITATDAALLPTRQFTVEEICRVFGVPPFMIGATDKSSSWGTGIEQQGVGFVKYTLTNHTIPLEQELNRKLWPVAKRYFLAHDPSQLERGDFKSRMEGYRIAIGRAGEPGWITQNEIRTAEKYETLPEGDDLNQGIAATTAPAEPPPAPPAETNVDEPALPAEE